MFTRVTRWLLYTLILSVFPIASAALARVFLKIHLSISELLGAGELLMICCAVCAAAVGELVGTKPKKPGWKLSCVCACIAIVGVTLIAYTIVVVAILKKIPYDESIVANISIFLFIVSGIVSSVCVGLAHEK